MNYKILITFVIVLSSTYGFSQNYRVVYNTDAFEVNTSGGQEYVRFRIHGDTEGHYIHGNGQIFMVETPKALDVISYKIVLDSRKNVLSECGQYLETISINPDACDYLINDNYTTACNLNTSYDISIGPLLDYESQTESTNTYCVSDKITIAADQGYDEYRWFIKNSSSDWTQLLLNGSTVSFNLQQLMNTETANYINQYSYFKYEVDDCDSQFASDPIGYMFTPEVPELESFVINEPNCIGDLADVEVLLNRSLYSGEVLTYTLKDSLHIFIAQNQTGIFNSIQPGLYRLSFQSNESFFYCGSAEETTFVIPNANPIEIYETVGQATCQNSLTGTATFTAAGGSGSGYTFSLDGQNFQSSSSFSNLSQGIHTIYVKDSYDCILSDNFYVEGPPSELEANLSIKSNYNGSAVTCRSSSDGVVEVQGTGGWGTYTYSLSDLGPFTSNNTFSNLSAGTIAIWIKDGSGCLIERTIELPAPLSITISVGLTNPICPGDFGRLNINAEGGTGSLQYSIDGSNYESSNEFFLPSGIYSALVQDENLCTYQITNLQIIDPLPISFEFFKSNPDCFGNSTGQIEINNILNGSPPYRYSIDGGASYNSQSQFINLLSGNYNIQVIDDNNCFSEVESSLSDPEPVSVDITESSISCYGDSNGALKVHSSGGTGAYEINWSTGSEAEEITNLEAGNFTVLITDTNGCESSPILYDLAEPPEIIITELISDYNGYSVSCNGATDGQIELLISGGTVIDDYDIRWTSGQTSSLLTNLTAGSYSVTIKDDNGCATSANYIVSEPSPISISNVSIENPLCSGQADGNITIEAVGGAGQFVYEIVELEVQSNGHFPDLASGLYTIASIDINGCMHETTVEVEEPLLINISDISTLSTSCGSADGEIEVVVVGGTPPYNYDWRDSQGNSIGSSNKIDGLAGGMYELIITDNNMCLLRTFQSINDTDGPKLSIQNISGISCSGSNDGSAEIEVSGGKEPYTILWSSGGSAQIETNLKAGLHSVSVTDDNGCVSFVEIEISDKDPIELENLFLTPPSCNGNSNGSIEIVPQGGTIPYTVMWNTGHSGNVINNVISGEYQVTVEDTLGCNTEFQIALPEPELIQVNTEVFAPSCESIKNGTVNVSITGGTEPYSIYLDGVLLNSTIIDSLRSTNYYLEVIDANGCSKDQNITIPNPKQLLIEMDELVICEGQKVKVNTPLTGDIYAWSYNNELIASTSNIIVDNSGIYSLKVITTDGCIATGQFSVTISNDVLNIDFLASSSIYTSDTIILIDITYPLPDSINWILPQGTELIHNNNDYALVMFKKAGIYEISMEAFLGHCYEIETKQIKVREHNANNPLGGRLLGEELVLIKESNVYPNPTDGRFFASYELNEPKKVDYHIISMASNRIVLSGKREEAYNHNIGIDLTDYTSGLYAIVLIVENEKHISRVLKR